ncbi:hypothetical protein PR202_ga27967 [Eleusine coracana subsp. coracana]|uniref:Uncharacterized protein n=1 Tax=Eleusine coracana subsp. coracana TaxID=191504 RepID=A0AAV5DG43_ELECO|nr:hypothetical protein PR202_ga27967 [Eleusine coracana subsp. coracana]
MERADENLLPAVYKEVSAAFNAGPTDLGYLTFLMNFLKSIASPLAGILALHYDRPTVLAIGTVFWALSTGAVGVSQHFSSGCVLESCKRSWACYCNTCTPIIYC